MRTALPIPAFARGRPAGLTSKILGKRLDLIYLDDMLNTDNTLTPYMLRRELWMPSPRTIPQLDGNPFGA